jgi:hypothetical protein
MGVKVSLGFSFGVEDTLLVSVRCFIVTMSIRDILVGLLFIPTVRARCLTSRIGKRKVLSCVLDDLADHPEPFHYLAINVRLVTLPVYFTKGRSPIHAWWLVRSIRGGSTAGDAEG